MTEQEKLEYTKFVLDKVAEHLAEGGTYRKLIYDRLGFTPESGAYTELISGLAISNAFCKLEELDDLQDIVFKIRKITNEIPAEWSNCETSYIKIIDKCGSDDELDYIVECPNCGSHVNYGNSIFMLSGHLYCDVGNCRDKLIENNEYLKRKYDVE